MTEPASTDSEAPRLTPHRRIHQWAFTPSPLTSRFLHFCRLSLRIVLIMYQEFFRTHLAIRASALTYSIILSLVPILALSTSILKGLGNDEQVKMTVIRFVDQWEPPPLHPEIREYARDGLPSHQAPATSESPPATDRPGTSSTAHLHRAVDIIFQYVDRTNFAALGIVGVIGLIGVVILVLSTIEDAMNAIWHTQKGRSVLRKIMDYLALLILLPLSLNVALAAEAVLANEKIMLHISSFIPIAWIAAFFIKLIPFVFIITTLMVMYLFFPHVRVKRSAALTGAVFASTFWFIVQKIYIALQVGVANYNAIYGSFASIPLFLIWLQIGWTFILLGASLAYAIQHHRHYHSSEGLLSPQRRLQVAFDILQAVYENFEQRRPASLSQLSGNLPHTRCADIAEVADQLIAGRLLRNVDTPHEKTFLPVTSAEKLSASEVVQLILGTEALPSAGGQRATLAVEAASSALNVDFKSSSPSPERS